MFCDLIKILLRIEFRTKGDIDYQGLRMRPCFENSIIPGYTPSFRGHERRKQHNKKSLWRKNRFFAQIVSLPFIRNHGFARNDIKGAVFKAFPAFSKAFHEMPKKKTVNLSIENAVLCFGVVSTNNFAVSVGAFSLTTAREILVDERSKQMIL